jgi:transcription termination factor Rho
MSQNNQDENDLFTTGDAAPPAKPARKRAAKKAAPETTGGEPPKPARKRAVKKSVETESSDEAPAPKARKTTRKAAPASEEPSPPSQESESPRRYGRVPGGGPIAATKAPEPAPRAPEPPAAPPAPPPAPPPAATPAPTAENEAPASRHEPQHNPRENNHRGNRDHNNNRDNHRDRDPRGNKRRRDKRKNRNDRGPNPNQGGPPRPEGPAANFQEENRANLPLDGPKIEANGLLELAPKGFGFLRVPGKNFEQVRDDVFVSPELIRTHGLRLGQWLHGLYQEGPRGPQLVEITAVNGLSPEQAGKLPHFDELKAINPAKRLSFETTAERFTNRVVDIMAPVGRGQRGLIVSPPRSGKTTLLLHMAEAVREKYEESVHLMVLLVDERPEEVTEFRRALPGAEIYASSNDELPRNHCRIAELAIERAKRLVEAGKDVFLLMDSITRLARAYNNTMNHRGRGTGSGGITIGALEVPRRLFAAARNTRGGGSLTILATALIQTNSRADEAIFMEFKGTGNMELVLDRKIAENYIYPAVDIFKSGTRREEILLPEHMLHKIHLIRRGLSGHKPVEAMERLLFFLKKFPNNPQMLLEIKG